jgi:beta-glucosidase
VEYEPSGGFEGVADVGIVVVGESPYAEGVGDRKDLGLSSADVQLIEGMREHSERLVVILLSGRPMIITAQLPLADAWVAAWLPGTEGAGVVDVLFGDYPFTGRLPYAWPKSMDQVPRNQGDEVLYPFGYGLP